MYKIAVIGGDGTGPEVVREGLKVLQAAGKKFNFKFETKEFDFSGQRYLKTGKLVDEKDVEELKKFNAIYLGAVGDPAVKPGIIETGVLLKLRFALDQY
ncbi:MAG: isocitrate/isopropylmalate family dehydrogenase, partial [Candidatus Omnitrophica bacterium]|nr:isocitrate/isopropylmalate family dehydrogenase [Candidatus Omnitrophota bacterium]